MAIGVWGRLQEIARITDAITPKGASGKVSPGEWMAWSRTVEKIFEELDRSPTFRIVPRQSVQFYYWDDEQQRLVLREGKQRGIHDSARAGDGA